MIPMLLASVLAQGVWETRAPYPIASTEVSAAALGGKVYALCGITGSEALYIYDPRYDNWTTGAPLPIPGGADHCNVAAAGGKLYLVGAIRIGSAFVSGDTFEYDPAADRWTRVAAMPTPRGASGVAAIGARIYVAGGLAAGGRSVATFEVFDVETKQWTRLPDMPTARDHLTAQAIGGKVQAISGRAANVLDANEEFDPPTGVWRRRAPIPTPRGGLASGAIGGRIQVFGGEGPSGTPEGTYHHHEEYDPAADTWRALPSMPTPRHGLYGATLDGRIFAPAGGPRAGGFNSSVHEMFTLPPAEPPALESARNAARLDGSLAPGAIVSLFGLRLSHGEQVAPAAPRTQMNAVVVRASGVALPLLYVGPSQVNAHLPYDLPLGPVTFAVTNAGSESAPLVTAPLTETAPGIFTLSQNGEGPGAILTPGTGQLARPRRGDAVEIYCTGLGRVVTAPGDPLARTVVEPEVRIGGARAEVLFSGLAPGWPGVYQVNARVPAGSAAGPAVPVTVGSSNTVTMAVME
ncbi:MAG: kelch repeat-containing protein [Bryobacteraceae bacterium]